jgi:hypothetical protein
MYLPNVVRGWEKNTFKLRSSWNRLKSGMINMPIKHNGMWNLKLGNTCG